MAKEYIERELFCNEFCRCASDYCTKEICPIWKTPTADVAPVVHGSWMVLDECANQGVYCSVCHKKVYKIDYSNTMKMKSNFCPNCGAKMDLDHGE